MKIVLFIPSLVGCGAERVIVNLANFLQSSGYDVIMLNYRYNTSPYKLDENVKRIFLYDRQDKQTFLKKCLQYFFTRSYERFNESRRISRLKKFVKSQNPDCYLVMLEQTTIDLLKLRKYISCPIIVSERNYPNNYPNNIKSKLYELAKLADGFVFQTESARDCYGSSVKNSTIIPNAINSDFLNIQSSLVKKRKAIVNVGRLEKQKNQELLIKAFAQANLADYILEIYGDGPLKEDLQRIIYELGISNRVFLKGHVSNIKESILDASLFVLSSQYEGIPNVLLEAMALGLPCITTDFAGNGAKVLIENGKNGIIVPNNDEKELASAMSMVLKNASLADKFSKNSLQKIKQFYPEKIYCKWEQYIIDIVNKRKNDNI